MIRTSNDFDHLYINGAWTRSVDDISPTTVFNSTTGNSLGRVPAAGAGDVDRAVRAARDAFPAWAALGVAGRNEILDALTAALEKRVDELAEVFVQQVGIVHSTAQGFQALSADQFRANAAIAAGFDWEHTIGGTKVVKEPIGVVAAITPWNYPLPMIVVKAAPALASGSTIVIKPAEVAPLEAMLLAEAAHEVGLPPGVLNVVSGTGPVAGEALAQHPGVDMISFTGSTRVGRHLGAVSGQTVKRLSLELGGKSAGVVLEDADLEYAVRTIMDNCMKLNSGQACSALTRIVVPRSQLAAAEEVVASYVDELVVGDPFEQGTTNGPMASAEHQERVRSYIRRGEDDGVRKVRGGSEVPAGLDDGYFVAPTVFTVEDPDYVLAQEEIFGPVQVLIPHDGDSHAVEIANGTIYGLAGAVFSGDDDRADHVARQVRAGQVDVNCMNFSPDVPFGGYKQSGNGRTWGVEGFAEFLETKSITARS